MQFLDFLSQLSGVSDPRHLIQILSGQISSLLCCKNCTFFLTDKDNLQIFTFSREQESQEKEPDFQEIRFPMTRETIVGYAALTGESLLLQVQTMLVSTVFVIDICSGHRTCIRTKDFK